MGRAFPRTRPNHLNRRREEPGLERKSDDSTADAGHAAVSVTVTIDGKALSSAIVEGSIEREAAENPGIADNSELRTTRGAASAALEELLVREGAATRKVTASQVDDVILQADSVFPVGAEPPKEWSDADRERALKDPEVRAAVERILYRSAGLASVLGEVSEDELTAETGNATVAAWFEGQLKSQKVVATMGDGTVLSDDELVRAARQLPKPEPAPQTVVGSGVPTPSDASAGN